MQELQTNYIIFRLNEILADIKERGRKYAKSNALNQALKGLTRSCLSYYRDYTLCTLVLIELTISRSICENACHLTLSPRLIHILPIYKGSSKALLAY